MPAAVAIEHDAKLFNLLRQKRKALADAANVPPYVIFSDRSLVEMAAYFPQNQPSLSQIYGVGERKLAQYGHDFLLLIRAYCKEHGIAEKPKAKMAVSRPKASSSRTDEIVKLYNDGRSVAEVATMLQVKERTILDHLWKAATAKRPLRPAGFLEATTLSQLEQDSVKRAFAACGTEFLRPAYEQLNQQISYDQLHLMRLYVVAAQH